MRLQVAHALIYFWGSMNRAARTPFASKENVLLPETYNVVKQASAPAPGMAKRKDLHVCPPLCCAKISCGVCKAAQLTLALDRYGGRARCHGMP